MRWGKAGFGVVLLLLISVMLLLIVGDILYYRMFYFLFIIFVLSAIWGRSSLHGVEVKRFCRNQRMQIGQLLEEKYEIFNNSPFAKLWIEVKDESNLPHSAGSRILTFIGPYQIRSYVCYTYLSRRGIYTLSPIMIRSGDIFGIFLMEKIVTTQEKILVTPYLFTISTGFEPVGLLPGGKAIKSKSSLASPFASGIREYQAGDALNYIHWKSSIRHSRIMVKEFDQDPQADVWLIIDACKKRQYSRQEKMPVRGHKDWIYGERNIRYQPETSMDYLSSIGASYAKYYIDEGKAVGLFCIDKSYITLPAERGERQYLKILDHLAMIQGIGDVSIQELVTFQSRYLPRGSLVIVISSSPEQEIVAGAVELQSRGFKPVILLVDPINLGFETKMGEIKDQLDTYEVINTLVGKVGQIQEIERFLVNRSVEYSAKWFG
jgi:uncharacterized protein (DUF58 family)